MVHESKSSNLNFTYVSVVNDILKQIEQCIEERKELELQLHYLGLKLINDEDIDDEFDSLSFKINELKNRLEKLKAKIFTIKFQTLN